MDVGDKVAKDLSILADLKEAGTLIGPWLSAALDDPEVCQEYKDAIMAWMDAYAPLMQETGNEQPANVV